LAHNARKYLEYIIKEKIDKEQTIETCLNPLPSYLTQAIYKDIFSKSLQRVGFIKNYFGNIHFQ